MKKLALIILMPLFIFLFNFQLLLNDNDFFFNEFEKNNVYSKFDLSKEKLNYEASNLINFLQGSSSLNDSVFYTKEELIHLNDVKTLIRTLSILFYIILAALIILIVYLIYKKEYIFLFNSLIYGSLITLALIVILSLFSNYGFSSLFRVFHIISFRNQYWLLPETASLIKLFPQEFFEHALKKIILNSIISSLTLLIISFISVNIAKKVIK